MSIIAILATLALIGVVTWAIVKFVPMPAPFPNLIIGAACILALLWLIGAAGGFQNFRF